MPQFLKSNGHAPQLMFRSKDTDLLVQGSDAIIALQVHWQGNTLVQRYLQIKSVHSAKKRIYNIYMCIKIKSNRTKIDKYKKTAYSCTQHAC